MLIFLISMFKFLDFSCWLLCFPNSEFFVSSPPSPSPSFNYFANSFLWFYIFYQILSGAKKERHLFYSEYYLVHSYYYTKDLIYKYMQYEIWINNLFHSWLISVQLSTFISFSHSSLNLTSSGSTGIARMTGFGIGIFLSNKGNTHNQNFINNDNQFKI